MKAAALSFMLPLALLVSTTAWARDAVLPAGTLLTCTMDEPNFSSASASVGDPVLCHPHGFQMFGQSVFPRGTYIVGHLADDKEPGHFWGKGYLKLEFDRIGFPGNDVPLSAKMVAVSGGYRVDKEGKVIGKGHATRDTVEWLIPPLWPWKIITLPMRGPRPKLKGETRVTLKVMDDVLIPDSASYRRFGRLEGGGNTYAQPALYLRPPKTLTPPSGLNDAVYRTISWQPQAATTQAAANGTEGEYHSPAADHAGWHTFKKSAAPAAAAAPVNQPVVAAADAVEADDTPAPAPAPVKTSAPDTTANTSAPINNADVNAVAPAKTKAAIDEQDIPPANTKAPATLTPAITAVPVNAAGTGDNAALLKTVSLENASPAASPSVAAAKPKLTLFALRAGTVYAVTDYWRDEDHLAYVLSSGKEGQVDMSELDWKTTTQLNAERNVKVTLREGR